MKSEKMININEDERMFWPLGNKLEEYRKECLEHSYKGRICPSCNRKFAMFGSSYTLKSADKTKYDFLACNDCIVNENELKSMDTTYFENVGVFFGSQSHKNGLPWEVHNDWLIFETYSSKNKVWFETKSGIKVEFKDVLDWMFKIEMEFHSEHTTEYSEKMMERHRHLLPVDYKPPKNNFVVTQLALFE